MGGHVGGWLGGWLEESLNKGEFRVGKKGGTDGRIKGPTLEVKRPQIHRESSAGVDRGSAGM